jgi:hypothetical protein
LRHLCHPLGQALGSERLVFGDQGSKGFHVAWGM